MIAIPLSIVAEFASSFQKTMRAQIKLTIHLAQHFAVSEYKATLKKRIEALEQFTTESAFASDDFDEEDTWISRKVVLAEIEKEGK